MWLYNIIGDNEESISNLLQLDPINEEIVPHLYSALRDIHLGNIFVLPS